ncbi:5510_t:CDS:1 [Racocetra fulgida]|uniref:5510_t:CDS:1 n=1 Tax=Racocetra fulgida TaxID=60492 RepID=A0A9N9GHW4_9GLOM|nr:5510_t:CDS:1 [Racocetra fulgida]
MGSISYAYLSTQSCPSDTMYLPIIQIPRSDFSLRPECNFVFQKYEISTASLIFLDEISDHLSIISKSYNLSLILLDHNKLIGIWNQFADKVDTILDHHQDEGLYLNIRERYIEGVGSATSLVVLKFKDTQNWNKIIANLLLSAILVDTALLDFSQGRTTQKDQEAVDLLLDILDPSDPKIFIKDYYDEIQNAKSNITHLSNFDLLRKDYKEYNLEWTTKNETKICAMGISSVVWTLKDWILREGGVEKFIEAVGNYIQEKKLDLGIIMLAFDHKGDVGFKREMVIYSKKGPFCQKEVLERFEKIIGLNEIKYFENGKGDREKEESTIKYYEQKDIKISRKKVYPIIKDMFLEA